MGNFFSGFGTPDIKKLEEKGDIQGLIKALDNQKDPAIREAAVLTIGRIGNKENIEPIYAALKDEDIKVRNAAVEVLNRTGDHQAVDPLIQMIREQDKYQQSAVNALVDIFFKITDETIEEEMIKKILFVLENYDGLSRIGAVEFAGKIFQNEKGTKYGDQISQSLIKLLEIDDRWLQGEVLKALYFGIQKLKSSDLYNLIADTVSQLNILKDAGLRKNALQILSVISDKIDNPDLRLSIKIKIKNYLDDQREEVRILCVQYLGKFGNEDDMMKLAWRLIYDVKQPIQKAAAEAMARINSQKAEEILLKMIDQFSIDQERNNIKKPNWYGAVKALGETGAAWVVKPLIAVLIDEDFIGSPSLAAASALGGIGDKTAVKPLTLAMETGDDYMKKYAREALKAITGK